MSELSGLHVDDADFVLSFFPVPVPGSVSTEEEWRMVTNLTQSQADAFREAQFAAHAVQCNCACK